MGPAAPLENRDVTQAPVNIAIVGATGYTGRELIALLLAHPHAQVKRLYAIDNIGKPVGEVFGQFDGLLDLVIEEPDYDTLVAECPVAFLCLPHAKAMDVGAQLHARGVKVIDFSADYRLKDIAVYEATYATKHTHPDLVAEAVYGLPELHRDAIAGATLLANPGCYPTGAVLSVAPLLRRRLVDPTRIIFDSKSGVSGAGRTPNPKTVFSECNENVEAYGVGVHRHQPEIEQECSLLFGQALAVHFTPHLVPMTRGILTTAYVELVRDTTPDEVHAAYAGDYGAEPLIGLLPFGRYPRTADVWGTNRCRVGLYVKGRRVVAVSAIDNLIKGASGQAVQCFNLMCGFDETEALLR
ncbi:MAG: N-acetyl-gamma-glutamyl-phosphate reductase [Verrucomicrobia bacterium]|nr:N-acetyl-gamma-glutamyl-phosphate reductase [Verrucomicrobiota bacterium]